MNKISNDSILFIYFFKLYVLWNRCYKCNCLNVIVLIIISYIELLRIWKGMYWKKKYVKSLYWVDFISWVENEIKNDFNIKNISFVVIGFIYVEVDNVFIMLLKEDRK